MKLYHSTNGKNIKFRKLEKSIQNKAKDKAHIIEQSKETVCYDSEFGLIFYTVTQHIFITVTVYDRLEHFSVKNLCKISTPSVKERIKKMKQKKQGET